jgi:hypothetical protein
MKTAGFGNEKRGPGRLHDFRQRFPFLHFSAFSCDGHVNSLMNGPFLTIPDRMTSFDALSAPKQHGLLIVDFWSAGRARRLVACRRAFGTPLLAFWALCS